MRINCLFLVIVYMQSNSIDIGLADSLNVTLVEFNQALVSNYPQGKSLSNATFAAVEPQFVTLGKMATKRELAMFMSQVFYESAGLKYKEELACYKDPPKCTYVNNTGGAPGKYYYGRGYIQLTHAYNYKAASEAIFHDDRLLKTPELVASDDTIAWKTAIWFWASNVHSAVGVSLGHFDVTTTRVNGAKSTSRQARFNVYKKVFLYLHVTGTPIM